MDDREGPLDRDEKVKINLPFEEAVSGLLKVDPDAEPAEDESPSRPVDAPPRRQAEGNK